MLTDHKSLEHFSTKRKLNARQTRWAELLSQYNYTLTYRPGVRNAATDALSRKTDHTKTQQEKADAERTMALFRPVSQFSDDSELQAVVALLEDENVPVLELSGVMLIEALLR